MKIKLRSAQCTEGRRMAGARALWIANGMKREMFGKPIIAIANSFTQLVPGHTHLHEAKYIKGNSFLQCFPVICYDPSTLCKTLVHAKPNIMKT